MQLTVVTTGRFRCEEPSVPWVLMMHFLLLMMHFLPVVLKASAVGLRPKAGYWLRQGEIGVLWLHRFLMPFPLVGWPIPSRLLLEPQRLSLDLSGGIFVGV